MKDMRKNNKQKLQKCKREQGQAIGNLLLDLTNTSETESFHALIHSLGKCIKRNKGIGIVE